MKRKYLILVSLILAILTIGAVSASDDASADVISEDSAGDDVIAEDAGSDELAAEDNGEDSVIEASDNDNVVEASESEDVLNSQGTYNGYDYWTYVSDDTFNVNPESQSTVGHVKDEGYVNGIVTFSIDGRQLYSKTYSSSDRIMDAYIYTSDMSLPAAFQSGIHTVTVGYIKLGAPAISTTAAMEFRFIPTYRYVEDMSVGETNYIRVIAGPGAVGTVTFYKYDNMIGYTPVGTVPIVNGQALFPVTATTKGTLDYAFSTTLNGKNYRNDDLYIYVKDNAPGYSASVSSKIYAGDSAVVSFSGSKLYGYVDIFVDGKLVRSAEYRGGKLSEYIPGLTVGTHQITVQYNRAHDFFSKTYNVNVVKKPTPKKISLKLKKVTVKKSAKKLVLKVTLKIKGKVAKKKKVIFKFNGKKFKAKTNKKGVAKVVIKKKFLKKLKVGKKVKYSVKYGKKTVKRTAKVKK